MGLLDSVMGTVLGAASGGGSAPGGDLLMQVVGTLLRADGPHGGLAGLVQQFQQSGLGEVVQSWISTGPNLPVSAEQILAVLGHERLGALAQQVGLPHGELAGQLAQWLPQVVDRLTPHGELPQGGGADPLGSAVGGLLGGLFGR